MPHTTRASNEKQRGKKIKESNEGFPSNEWRSINKERRNPHKNPLWGGYRIPFTTSKFARLSRASQPES